MLKPSPSSIFISATISIFLLGFWFLLMPLLREWGTAQANLESLQKVGALSINKNTSKTAQNGQQLREGVLSLLPPEDAQYDLSVQVEALSKSMGINLTSLNLTSVEPKVAPKTAATEDGDTKSSSATPAATPASSGKKVTITVGASGPYANMQQFVQGLTSMERFVQIDQLTMTSAKSDGTVNLQLTAFAYYQP